MLVNSIYEMKNYPVVLLNTVLSPLSFLLLIYFVSGGRLIGDAIEGGFIMSMFNSGMSLQGDLAHLKNDFKLQDMVVSSPTSPAAYVTGMALAEVIYSVPALAVLTVLAAIYLHPAMVQALELLGVFLFMFLTSIAIGYTLSTFSSDIVQSFAFSRLISTLFSTLPPVYYPITLIPLPYRYVAYLSPTTYAAEISQNATGFLSLSTYGIVLAWGVLFATTALLTLIAVKKARWRDV
ncbi:MAG: ABC transporter permease [Nitrososphaerales archaeon]